jgi:hypothetical protein
MPKATCSEKPQLNLSFATSGTQLLVFIFGSSVLTDSLSSTRSNQATQINKQYTHLRTCIKQKKRLKRERTK